MDVELKSEKIFFEIFENFLSVWGGGLKKREGGVSEGMLFRVKFILMDVELKSKKFFFDIFENFSKCLGGQKNHEGGGFPRVCSAGAFSYGRV